ncbi:MAG: hypothetical protein HY326_02650 [Chloroflexi bacterium]|nr:hypothetical protein [Chloroflexota bacterium]
MIVPSSLPSVRPLLTPMRWWFLVDSGLVFITGIQLFIFSEFTARFFAWTINPALTAAFLGACYWGSFPMVFLAAQQKAWDRARIAVPAVLLFTSITLIATLFHLDRFHLAGSEPTALIAGWAWMIVYIVVPPTMIILLILQLRTPGDDAPRLALLPSWIRLVFAIQGVFLLLLGVVLFVAPVQMVSLWPWQLSPLTGRAVAAWLVGVGATLLQMVWENDLERIRPALISLTLFSVLQLIAVARFASTINWGATAWIYVAFLTILLLVNGYSLVIGQRNLAPLPQN